ncbi:hypothetical protein Tco_0068834 [Tanacetum coccineum]
MFRGMLILDVFLTDEIRATDDYKEYDKVVEGEKDAKSYVSKFVASMLDDDDDVNDDEQKDEKKYDVGLNEMDNLENRTKKMQTPIPTTPRSLRINLSSDKIIVRELT